MDQRRLVSAPVVYLSVSAGSNIRTDVLGGAPAATPFPLADAWLVPASSMQAINGPTRLVGVNLVTGEEDPRMPVDPAE